MADDSLILALDQGTTSSRAVLFDHRGTIRGLAQQEFPQLTPLPAHVEHDPEDIWSSQLATARDVLTRARVDASRLAAIGVTNQRETTLLWERDTGRPVHNAIVWQSRISAGICQRLMQEGWEPRIHEKTGLLIDPYFSGTKIRYLLDSTEGLSARAERGEILFGTVDSYLIWRLTGGRVHVTDYTNASRTLLYDIHQLDWDDELLGMLKIPRAMMPEVKPSSGWFGETDPQWLGRAIPITGVAGDQQAATFGQACFQVGSAKNTYGTGCFVLMNTGSKPVRSQHRLLTTIGWGLGDQVTYCLEGAIFVAGAAVQWLRDGLGLFQASEEVESLATRCADTEGLVFVPALVGLGAPHWDANARGTLIGITRGTTAAHVARATLEAMAFQTRDVLEAMQADAGRDLKELKVDGGASVNNTLMQFQADMLGVEVRRPTVAETTALGAAYLAGLAVGYWQDTSDVERNWELDRVFQPEMPQHQRERRYRTWRRAVERAKQWETAE